MQSVLPEAQGSWVAALFEWPTRSPPNQATTTWPLASASTQGKTLTLPTVAPELTPTAGLQVVPRSIELE